MIFSSYAYLTFLTVVVGAYCLLERFFPGLRRSFLLLASLVFYAWWRIDFIALLLLSTLVNFGVGQELTRAAAQSRRTTPLLVAGLIFNLALIAVFKYAGFFAISINAVVGLHFAVPKLFLPLAISFFTFEQISYLVDASRGEAPRYGFLDYALFVSFFPHLIAGPIIRHNDLIPQFAQSRDNTARDDDLAVGTALFTIGLAKKTLIADNLAPFSDAVFAAAHQGAAISTTDAWLGTLFFAFQIYFDFSGYTDMALGSACLFGIRLPLNFNSPYKSASIIEFWRRWHISLSTFLRDYLYIPLGGNKHGSSRRYLNLMITMLLGGLWHGASWTFVVWGGLHGAYLSINHAWRSAMRAINYKPAAQLKGLSRAVSVGITFLAVIFAWTIFRADGFPAALRMIQGLVGHGGDSRVLSLTPLAIGAMVLLFAIVWCAPNSMQITARLRPALESAYRDTAIQEAGWFAWKPTRASAFVVSMLFVVSFMALSNLSPFIYFQF